VEPLPAVGTIPVRAVFVVLAATPVLPVVLALSASLALLAGDGEVRTSVAVSLRGTAFCVASAASFGLTPTVAGAEAVAATGAAVCAEALAAVRANAAASAMDLMIRFMCLPLFELGGNTKIVLSESCG
jgi:hypothetical protein